LQWTKEKDCPMKFPRSATRSIFALALVLTSAAPLPVAQAADGLLSLARSCGKNAYRNSDGDCQCKRHYEAHNGKCVSVRSTYGAEARPSDKWPSDKPGCWTWLKMCRENDVAACQFYEGTCT
jgi:hypothetical protein